MGGGGGEAAAGCGGHNKEHPEEMASPQPRVQQRLFTLRMGLGNATGRSKKLDRESMASVKN